MMYYIIISLYRTMATSKKIVSKRPIIKPSKYKITSSDNVINRKIVKIAARQIDDK